MRLNLDSSLKRRPGSIPLQSSFLVRGTIPNGGVDGWASKSTHVLAAPQPKCPSAKRLRMVQDTGAPNEGATCTWMVADKAIGMIHFLRCGGFLDD
ncbi:hypothetical protein TNCV_2844101 [Trichonephila clavipes]|nr:hypothetical protein TNCV_2844101 [Trichonephila clavipes]